MQVLIVSKGKMKGMQVIGLIIYSRFALMLCLFIVCMNKHVMKTIFIPIRNDKNEKRSSVDN